jgi:hypothetical protein
MRLILNASRWLLSRRSSACIDRGPEANKPLIHWDEKYMVVHVTNEPRPWPEGPVRFLASLVWWLACCFVLNIFCRPTVWLLLSY